MPTVIQDPAFNDVDKMFFEHLSVEIVHMKAKDNAWTKIKSDSLLFAPTFLLFDAPVGLIYTAEAHAREWAGEVEDRKRAVEQANREEAEEKERKLKEGLTIEKDDEKDDDLSSGEWEVPAFQPPDQGDQSMLPFNPADRPAVYICHEKQVKRLGKDGTPLLTDYDSVEFPQNDREAFYDYAIYIRKET